MNTATDNTDNFTWPCGCISPAAGGDVTVPCTDCADPDTPGLGPDVVEVETVREVTRPLIEAVRPGSRVTILTPQGQRRTGRAVMRSTHGGWVLNMGGRYGTPGIADDRNTVAVRGGR